MRLYNYKLLNDMCDSLTEAVSYMTQSGDMSVLKTCADFLCAIQNNLEVNKKSLKTEKAFDIILKMSNEFIDIMNDNSKGLENITVFAKQLSETISNDINYKLRVLFVAELGGKWDSMSSVYEEFIKRDDCEVDVVLQPIFRTVNYSDGTTGNEVVYEDYLTPMGIKHILYDKYDMEKIKPDITFFSQPYESCTLPMFWPENMSKYTKVVYLPYFSSRTIKKSVSSTFESYFLSKTQQYAWKIACQSEVMKKYFELFASRKGENVVVTGIPKWDYPFRINKENTPCPKEWSKKIKNRKVILWGTHFSTVTNGNIPFGNIIDIINIFKNRKDAVLIWRPHPMTDTVVKLYSPGLYPRFRELISEIENSDNMLIDRFSTYDNAFVWSDALISDESGSSLEYQYILMDKPSAQVMRMSEDEIFMHYYATDKLWDYSKSTFLKSNEEIEGFVEMVCSGKDDTAENRKYLKENFFKYADGNVGKRLTERLLRDFYEETGLTGSKSESLEKNRILVMGPEADSLPCIKQLEELGIDFKVCSDYIETDEYSIDVQKFSLHELSADKFDVIIITDSCNQNTVSEFLKEIYGIPGSKIMRFWATYSAFLPMRHCDRMLMNPKKEKYEGLILGISHTEVGIIAEDLKKDFINLALSSQDLYYQLKTFEYCLFKYPDKLKDIKYAIIDLYDYKYFNYDTSLSTSAVKYLTYGGYNMDPHNFERNKNCDYSYDYANECLIAKRFSGLKDIEIDIWKKWFENVYKYSEYEGFSPNLDIKKRISIVTKEAVEEYIKPSGSIVKIFPDTIKENIQHLESIFKKLLSINENIKIYTIIIPKYIESELGIQENMAKFVRNFDDIIEYMHSKYEFTMLDFNKISDISMKKSLYFDAAHLNYFGAKMLTDKLNEIIFDGE